MFAWLKNRFVGPAEDEPDEEGSDMKCDIAHYNMIIYGVIRTWD